MNEKVERVHIEQIEQQIVGIISTVSGKPIERGTDNLQSLNLDSLAKLEIMTLLENTFRLSLTEESARQFTSISSIARIIVRTLDAQHSQWKS